MAAIFAEIRADMAAIFAGITCTLLILGVLWGLAYIFSDIAGHPIWRRRATWRFGMRSLLLAIFAASVAFGLVRLGIDVFFPVVVGLVGVATLGAVVRLLFLALSPRSETSSASALRETSQPIGPPTATEEQQGSSEPQDSVKRPRSGRRKWWLKNNEPTFPTNAPRF